jgi:hypothetical protein
MNYYDLSFVNHKFRTSDDTSYRTSGDISYRTSGACTSTIFPLKTSFLECPALPILTTVCAKWPVIPKSVIPFGKKRLVR